MNITVVCDFESDPETMSKGEKKGNKKSTEGDVN